MVLPTGKLLIPFLGKLSRLGVTLWWYVQSSVGEKTDDYGSSIAVKNVKEDKASISFNTQVRTLPTD